MWAAVAVAPADVNAGQPRTERKARTLPRSAAAGRRRQAFRRRFPGLALELRLAELAEQALGVVGQHGDQGIAGVLQHRASPRRAGPIRHLALYQPSQE